jgi:hypothetical protein
MTNLAGKVKDKLKGAKDTVNSKNTETTGYDSTEHYEASEPMSAAKIKEHEPTAVKREMTEIILTSTDPEEAREKARRSGMTKGTTGA